MRIFIAGGGHVASFLATKLVREGHELVLVEQDEERCRQLEANLDAKVVWGNAASIATWKRAGIAKAEMFIAVTQSDELNLLAGLIAHSLAPQAVRAIRLRTHEFGDWRTMLEDRGVKIDRVIHPETDIIARILRVLPVPGVSEIRDFAGDAVKLVGMNVDATSWLAGQTLAGLDRRGAPKNAMVAMIFRGQEVLIPRGQEVLQSGDHIHIVALGAELDALLGFMGIERRESLERVFIVGGEEVGIAVAAALERQGVSVKLFEQDAQQCEQAASLLHDSLVIHGDGTDQQTLWRENVEGVDAFLALTPDDNANLLVSLLARRWGAKKLVAQVNRLDYLRIAQALGINSTVSPRLKAADAILELVRKGGVVSVRTFREEEAEAIELVAPANCKYIGRPLRELRLPRDAKVGAIARPSGEVIVPRGDAVIEAGDRVVFFALEGCIPQLESAFLVDVKKRPWSLR